MTAHCAMRKRWSANTDWIDSAHRGDCTPDLLRYADAFACTLYFVLFCVPRWMVFIGRIFTTCGNAHAETDVTGHPSGPIFAFRITVFGPFSSIAFKILRNFYNHAGFLHTFLHVFILVFWLMPFIFQRCFCSFGRPWSSGLGVRLPTILANTIPGFIDSSTGKPQFVVTQHVTLGCSVPL